MRYHFPQLFSLFALFSQNVTADMGVFFLWQTPGLQLLNNNYTGSFIVPLIRVSRTKALYFMVTFPQILVAL